MSDSGIGVPLDGPGKIVDAEQTVTGYGTVQRERMEVTGAAAAEIARVLNSDPSPSDYALVVRTALAVSAKTSTASVATVGVGATGSVDSTQLSAATTGKLMRFEASGSVPFKVELQTVVNAVATTRIVRFGRGRDVIWETPDKDFVTQAYDAGVGFDGFRLLFTNLDTGSGSADFYGTFFWDEV